MPRRIYLDHAATTPIRPEALAAMQGGFALWANPSSPHAEGRKAKAMLEEARDEVKTALGWAGEVIFTSGASEALAIALNPSQADRRFVSAVEHDAVFRAAPDADVISVDHGGLVMPATDLHHSVAAIQAINSETGTLLLAGEDMAHAAAQSGATVLADCSQSAGKAALPHCDMAVVSAHKLGGPVGIGALLVRDYALLKPTGGHERGYRQGTENLPGAMGLAAALACGGQDSWATSADQRQAFSQRMADFRLTPGQVQCDYIYALTHPSLSAQALLIRLDALGFAISAGSACSSGTLKKSRVLDAFGVDDQTAARTVRVSLGWSTTPDDLDAFAEAWMALT